MESTGIYGVPVYEILGARGLTVLLVNARDVKNVPGAGVRGRKSGGYSTAERCFLRNLPGQRMLAPLPYPMDAGRLPVLFRPPYNA